MRTVVYQSFRTQNVPPWIERCMLSARNWAKVQGFDYRFWDDSFFDFVPDELQPRARTHVCLLSDYARLVAAKKLLQEGYDRAIWIDADAAVFAPEKFTINITSGYAFTREVWHDFSFNHHPFFKLTVNNSVSVFCRDENIIDYYLGEATKILLSDIPLKAISIGTPWLHDEKAKRDFPLLTQVGIFGPEMMFRYLQNDERYLAPYLRYQTSPISVINLCNSKLGAVYHFDGQPWVVDNASLCEIIDRLQADKGASLNAHFRPSYTPSRREFHRPLSAIQHWTRRVEYSRIYRFLTNAK